MAAPTYSELGALMGRTVGESQGAAVLSVITSLASAYTRGVGFDDGVPNDEIKAVILTASARLLSHPRQVGIDETIGPQSARLYNAPVNWSVAELMVLNRYRVRAL